MSYNYAGLPQPGSYLRKFDPAAPLSRTEKILKCKPKVAVFDYLPNDELLEVLENLRSHTCF